MIQLWPLVGRSAKDELLLLRSILQKWSIYYWLMVGRSKLLLRNKQQAIKAHHKSLWEGYVAIHRPKFRMKVSGPAMHLPLSFRDWQSISLCNQEDYHNLPFAISRSHWHKMCMQTMLSSLLSLCFFLFGEAVSFTDMWSYQSVPLGDGSEDLWMLLSNASSIR